MEMNIIRIMKINYFTAIVKEREAREEREARSTPAYGRRVSVRAGAGTLYSFLVCGPYRFLFTDPSTVALSEL